MKKDSTASFLQVTSSQAIISNAITALIAPEQYDGGLAAIQRLKGEGVLANMHPNIGLWISVWSGFSLIVNRVTPNHRDFGGAPSDYDLLVSAGTHVDCILDIADLGASFSYQPGTAIAVVGKVLRHGVKCWDGGEQICQAHFMKDAVRDCLGLSQPSWVNYADYIRLTYDQV